MPKTGGDQTLAAAADSLAKQWTAAIAKKQFGEAADLKQQLNSLGFAVEATLDEPGYALSTIKHRP
jgi:hypothetical protein